MLRETTLTMLTEVRGLVKHDVEELQQLRSGWCLPDRTLKTSAENVKPNSAYVILQLFGGRRTLSRVPAERPTQPCICTRSNQSCCSFEGLSAQSESGKYRIDADAGPKSAVLTCFPRNDGSYEFAGFTQLLRMAGAGHFRDLKTTSSAKAKFVMRAAQTERARINLGLRIPT
jgi:hypothetical protein